MMAAGPRARVVLGTTPATDVWATKTRQQVIDDIRALFDGTPPGAVPEVMVVESIANDPAARFTDRQQSRARGALVKHGRKAARWR